MCRSVFCRGETSGRITCASTLLLSERVSERAGVFVFKPLPHTYTPHHFLPGFHKLTYCHGGWYYILSIPLFNCVILICFPTDTKALCVFRGIFAPYFLRSKRYFHIN